MNNINVSIKLNVNDESSNFQSNKNNKNNMENEWLIIFPKRNELYKNPIKYPTVFKTENWVFNWHGIYVEVALNLLIVDYKMTLWKYLNLK